MNPRSDFLFASPSVLEGIARIWDFGATLNEYNYSQSDEQADMMASSMDWAMVGDDMRTAVRIFKAQDLVPQS